MVKLRNRIKAAQDELNQFHIQLAKGFAYQWGDLYDELCGMADRRKLDIPRAVRIGEWARLKYLERIGVGNVSWARNESLSEDELADLIEARWRECDLSEEEENLLQEEAKFVNLETYQFAFDRTIQTSLSDSQILQAEEWHAATSGERAIAFGLWAYIATNGGLIKPEASMYYFRLTLDLLGFIQDEERSKHAEKMQETFLSDIGKKTVSNRIDQKLKPLWEQHCKKASESGVEISQLKDLFQIEGCSTEFKKHIDERTLRRWAKESAGIEFKPGRPKK